MTSTQQWRVLILFLLLGCTVGCDQTSKHVARKELSERGSIDLPGGFGRLEMAENPGSFLGLGDSLSATWRRGVFTIADGVGLLALLIYLAVSARPSHFIFLGLTLMLAGGVGNLIDRILQNGFVTDFIYLRAGPLHTGIFNVADMLIMAGGAVVLVSAGLMKSPPLANSANQPVK